MTTRKPATLGLLAGGLSSCAMATYHFILPFAWHWGRWLGSLPPAIRWASYSMNFFMSYLMLAGGVLTLVACCHANSGRSPDRGIVAAMASFWLVNTLYQVLVPMPLPSHLFPLRLALVGFAVLTAGAHGIAFRALGAAQAAPV